MRARVLALLLCWPFALLATPDRAEDIDPIAVGTPLPDVQVQTIEGASIGAREALAGTPTVMVFFRGGWCPYCNRQLAELRLIQDDLAALGYRLVAVSPDRPESLREGLNKTPVDYRLLSDAAARLIRALGIAFRVDDATIEQYKGYGIDLEAASGHDHHLLPVPTVLLVDTSGVIRYRYSNADYKVRMDPDALLSVAASLRGEQATTNDQ